MTPCLSLILENIVINYLLSGCKIRSVYLHTLHLLLLTRICWILSSAKFQVLAGGGWNRIATCNSSWKPLSKLMKNFTCALLLPTPPPPLHTFCVFNPHLIRRDQRVESADHPRNSPGALPVLPPGAVSPPLGAIFVLRFLSVTVGWPRTIAKVWSGVRPR